MHSLHKMSDVKANISQFAKKEEEIPSNLLKEERQNLFSPTRVVYLARKLLVEKEIIKLKSEGASAEEIFKLVNRKKAIQNKINEIERKVLLQQIEKERNRLLEEYEEIMEHLEKIREDFQNRKLKTKT